jgi:hypothetical protein
MWLQGCTSGLLWSIGNFFSVISVENLGEGIGYSVIQVRDVTRYVRMNLFLTDFIVMIGWNAYFWIMGNFLFWRGYKSGQNFLVVFIRWGDCRRNHSTKF